MGRRCRGAYSSSRVVFGVSPNTDFRRDAGNCARRRGEGAPPPSGVRSPEHESDATTNFRWALSSTTDRGDENWQRYTVESQPTWRRPPMRPCFTIVASVSTMARTASREVMSEMS